jgi:hypothetical protein
MRFERFGEPPDLQAAFKDLVLGKLKGRALDDNRAKEAAAGGYPDFACFRDIVLIEMKHLETDQHGRINRVLNEKVDPLEMPVFYGSRDASLILDSISNASEVNAAVYTKLGRTIEGLLSKANRQFGSYPSRHPRKNNVNLCVILNAALREFTPDVVVRAIHGKMKTDQPLPRFPHIDAVLYISEKHFRRLTDGRVAMAMAIYEAAGAIEHPWKMGFVDRVVDAWSRSRVGGPAVQESGLSGFETVHDIPPTMARSDTWLLEYERTPYLASYSDRRLQVLFHRVMAVNSLTFIKGSWPKPSHEATSQGLRIFQHVIAETNRRGLDMQQFDRRCLTPDEEAEVHEGIPAELIQMLTERDA